MRIKFSPFSPNANIRFGHLDRLAVLSQWQRLDKLDPTSQNYVELLEKLIDIERNRKLTLELTGGDAGAVINILDRVGLFHQLYSLIYALLIGVERQALRSGVLKNGLANHSFSVLRKLAGNTGKLPYSYSLGKRADYQVGSIFASGGFADVRKGTLAKKPVAVKTIRIMQDMDISKVRKVGFIMRASSWF